MSEQAAEIHQCPWTQHISLTAPSDVWSFMFHLLYGKILTLKWAELAQINLCELNSKLHFPEYHFNQTTALHMKNRAASCCSEDSSPTGPQLSDQWQRWSTDWEVTSCPVTPESLRIWSYCRQCCKPVSGLISRMKVVDPSDHHEFIDFAGNIMMSRISSYKSL